MPMYRDPDRQCEKASFPEAADTQPPALTRQLSEESIPTELCDGPLLLDSDRSDLQSSQEPLVDYNAAYLQGDEVSGRQDLIKQLKNRQSPPLLSLRQRDTTTASENSDISDNPENIAFRRRSPLLLPAIELKNIGSSTRDGANNSSSDARLYSGPGIERPKSALHAGDFTHEVEEPKLSSGTYAPPGKGRDDDRSSGPLDSSPTTPWYHPSRAHQGSLRYSTSQSRNESTFESKAAPIGMSPRPLRSRAPSLQSDSSSFVLKAPTSPLVQQANNEDLDSIPMHGSRSLKENRRHTLPPNSLQALRSLNSGLAQMARQPPSLQREETFPATKAQYRRSLGAQVPGLGSFSPPTPSFLHSRRTSFSGEASPLQHSSMVGSYEESILRGRMSGIPSKPLDFTAKIGALGKGDCKPKYPAHVSIQFPAVFYSWSQSNAGRTPIDDEPSPYVGQIDIEHNLPPPQRKRKRSRRREAMQLDDQDESSGSPSKQATLKQPGKRRHRSASPAKLPIGGSYRIPQEGHLQIVIKNPNKTAVKLFLVPYDLHGMEAGTKTFIRQKCFSAGPVIENPITSKSDTAIDTKTTITKDKPTLRYLIHLQICCPSKGHFYLYKNISVVFANRVPDNKENLKNEIRLPEPRFSPYKPDTEFASSLTADTKRSIEKASRRRSYGCGTVTSGPSSSFDAMQGLSFPRGLSYQSPSAVPPVPQIPFPFATPEKSPPPPPLLCSALSQNLASLPTFNALPTGADGNSDDIDTNMGDTPCKVQSPLSDKSSRECTILSPILSGSVRSSSSNNSNDSYNKLARGDVGYGGVFGRPSTPEPGEGLLARKLKGLDVEQRKRLSAASSESEERSGGKEAL